MKRVISLLMLVFITVSVLSLSSCKLLEKFGIVKGNDDQSTSDGDGQNNGGNQNGGSETKKYNVVFDFANGTSSETISFEEGGIVNIEAPVYPGYTFDGWYCNGVKWDVETGKVSSDMTLVAKWTLNVYSLEYNVVIDGVTHSNRLEYDVTMGEVELLPMEKEGFIFDGWYLDENYSTKVITLTPEVFASSSIKLYAKWTALDEAFEYVITDGKAELTACNSTASHIVIPEKLGGCDVYKIGSGVFENRADLISITLPDTVEIIADNAFAGCSSLVSFTANGLKLIGEKAFYMCISITVIIIPEGVTEIGKSAFEGCKSATKIEIADSVLTIGDSAFSECSAAATLTLGNNVTYIGANSFYLCVNITVIIIPDSVTEIGNSAFEGCSSATTITVGNGVTKIGDSAFSGCSAATDLTLGNNVTYIGANSFYLCVNITVIIIPDSVTEIGKSAFEGCSAATTITVGNGVTKIGDSAFSGCSSATDLTLGNNVTYIGANSFYLCVNITVIIIPDSVTEIGNSAFEGCSAATTITVGNGVTKIGDSAFSGCSSATDLTLGNSVTYIGANSFYLCINITIIIIPDSVTEIGNSAFEGCSAATTITVGNGVTKIGDSAFSGCSSATDLTLGNNVTFIGDSSFYLCIKITVIIIPGSVREIGNNSFKGCSSAETIKVGNGVTKIGDSAFEDCTSAKDVTLGNNVTYIGSNAFYMCVNITVIVMPEGMSYVGKGAFGGCKSISIFLTFDKIPENWDEFWLGIEETIYEQVYAKGEWEYVGSDPVVWDDEWVVYREATCTESGILRCYAKNDPTRYKSQIVAATGHDFQNGVCKNCNKNFTDGMEYTLSADKTYYTLTSIGESSATELIIPDNIAGIPVTVIGASAFYNNKDIVYVEIPDSVIEIGERAFQNCTALKTVVIGKGVKTIGSLSFYNTTAMEELYFNATAAETVVASSNGTRPFMGMGKSTDGTKVYIGANVESIPSYLFCVYISYNTSYHNIASITFENGSVCKSIGDSAFAVCDKITEFVIPETVETIGVSAFSGCSMLKEIYVPDSVKSIGKNAFSGCVGLEKVNLPFVGGAIDASLSNLTLFGCIFGSNNSSTEGYVTVKQYHYVANGGKWTETFRIPAALKEVTVRGGSLHYGSFMNCTMIEKITLGDSITVLPESVFEGCTALSVIKMSNAVTEIGAKAFYNCSSLVSLALGGALQTIGDMAFYGMSSLGDITADEGCGFKIINGVIYSADGKSLVYYPASKMDKSLVIPEGVEVISSYAFYGNKYLENITFPSTLKEISTYAFTGAVSLERASFPDSLTLIGERAFEGCTSLSYINLPKNLTTLSKYAFYDCVSLTEIYFEASNLTGLTSNNFIFTNAGKNSNGITFTVSRDVTVIPANLFAQASVYSPTEKELLGSPNVTSIVFEDGSQCKTIGDSAFAYLVHLNYVYFAAVEMDDFASGNGVFAAAGAKGEGVRFVINKDVKKIPAYLVCPATVYYPEKFANVIGIEFEENTACTRIEKYAFAYLTALEKITIHETITYIGESAFVGCTALTEINYFAPSIENYTSNSGVFSQAGNNGPGVKLTIGKNVLRIPAYMFGYKPYSNNAYTAYNNITSIIIEDGSVCREIGEYAFAGCMNVSYFYYGITAIEDFEYTTTYRFNYLGQGAKEGITFVIGKSVTRIPAYMMQGNREVKITNLIFESTSCSHIGNYAFAGAFKGTSLTIPEFVTYLGWSSFREASYVTELKFNANVENEYDTHVRAFYGLGEKGEGVKLIIGKNVTSIPAYMFATYSSVNNDKITNIISLDFEDGSLCTSIGEYAFYYCKTLKSVKYPNSLTEIASNAFSNCTGIEEYLAEDGGEYVSIDGNLYSADKKTLIKYGAAKADESFTVPDFVEIIGDGAFRYAANLKSVSFGAGVHTIGASAFASCTSLEKINLGKNIISLGNSAFAGCTAVTEIYYDIPSLADFGRGNYVFNKVGISTDGVKLIFGENVERIPAYLFAPEQHPGMSSITTDVPKITSYEFNGTSVTEIGEAAFYWCKYITEIHIPASVTKIGKYAFGYCEGVTKLTVPGTVTEIGDSAFQYCKALCDVTLEEGITKIVSRMFTGCSSLTEIKIPDSVTEIANAAFSYSGLQILTIPKNVTKLSSEMVSHCGALTRINYNATYISGVSNYVFSYAGQDGEGIQVFIGKNVEKIPNYLFGPYIYSSEHSPKIISVEFEEGSVCKTIGTGAFYYCVSLKSIVIPESVTEILKDAFQYCNGLENVYYRGTKAQYDELKTNVAQGNENFVNAEIYCYSADTPESEGNFWHYDENGNITVWPEWEPQSQGLVYEFVENGGDSYYVVAGMGTATDTDIIIPSKYMGYPVREIGIEAFSNRSSITSVTIPGSVKNICNSAFKNCNMLVSISIPDSVTSIGGSVFNGCTALTSVTIPDSVISIGSYAFSGCKSLTKVTIPYGVKIIQQNTFYGCVNLANLIIADSVESIAQYAFHGCANLTNVIIPDSVANIEQYAFSECTNLTSVTLGKGVKSIGYCAFKKCVNLAEINFNATAANALKSDTQVFLSAGTNVEGIVVNIGENVTVIPDHLFNTNDVLKIKTVTFAKETACESIGAYAFYNCKYLDDIKIPDTVTAINSYAFGNCISLTSITIPIGVTTVSYAAFYRCIALESVIMHEKIEVIESSAFIYCTKLTSVTVPNSVKRIDGSAFRECTSLESIIIPEGVTSIGASAFNGCSALTSVTIPSTVANIGDMAFAECKKLTEINYNAASVSALNSASKVFSGAASFNNSWTITLNIGPKVTKIPAYLFCDTRVGFVRFDEGSLCKNIGEYAFKSTRVYNINIPGCVTRIGDCAFQYCSNLSTIYYQGTVEQFASINIGSQNTQLNSATIYYYTETAPEEVGNFWHYDENGNITVWPEWEPQFEYNFVENSGDSYYILAAIGTSKDTEIVVPETYNGYPVRKIGTKAFYENENITSLTIGKNVTVIEESAFHNCTSLKSVTFGDGVVNIVGYAFYNCSALETLVIGSSVKEIGGYAFSECAALTSVTIPNSVTMIDFGAFSDCISLTSVTIPDSVTVFGASAFNGCTALTDVTIGKGLEQLDMYFFYECESLKTVTIPEGIKTIGYSAFGECSSLLEVIIPSSVTSINNEAFWNCRALSSIYYSGSSAQFADVYVGDDNTYFYEATLYYYSETEPDSEGNFWHYDENGNITVWPEYQPPVLSYELVENGTDSYYVVKGIGTYNDTNVIIPETYEGYPVREIGERAFYGITSITSVVIPDSITNIGTYAFCRCTALESVTLGDGITAISEGAFYTCTALTSVNMPNSIVSIDMYSFFNCKVMTNVIIPDSVTSIGDYAFAECYALASIIIPDGVTSIGTRAFESCFAATSLTIGSSVKTIGDLAFYYCSGLTEINFNAVALNAVASYGEVFSYAGSNGKGMTLNVGEAVTNIPAYLFCTDSYGRIKDIVFAEGGICESIGAFAFSQCIPLASVIIPDSIISIGSGAFDSCTRLTSVTIGNNVTSIPSSAFSDCTSLTSVTVGNNVTSIGSSAFSNCTSLTSITMGSSVTKIGEFAFYRCTSLTSIIIPNGVTNIAYCAFGGCTNLESLTIPASVTYIGNDTFSSCSKLANVYYSGTEAEWAAIFIGTNNTALTNATFYIYSAVEPEVVGNFWHYDENGNVTVWPEWEPPHLEYVFEENGGDSYYVVKGIGTYEDTDVIIFESYNGYPVRKIADNAFSCCSNLTSIYIPDSVVTIGTSAFESCWGLKNVKIGNGVTTIGAYAFYWCLGLNSVVIPDGVTIIGSYAFDNCNKLVSVTIPDSIEIIGSYAFRSCKSLTSVSIGKNVTTVGDSAFYACTNLTEINFNAVAMSSLGYTNKVFYNAGKDGTGITVNVGNEVTVIPSNLFYMSDSTYAPKIITVNFTKDSVCESIGGEAFYRCSSLESVVLAESIKSVSSCAFYNCTNLKNVYYFGSEEAWSAIEVSMSNDPLTNATITYSYKAD